MISLTFSWDDGAIEDLKLIDLSLKYKIPGMFFIPATNFERKVMEYAKIKEMAKAGFEIGAHTYSHTYLTEVSLMKAEEELFKGKEFLEQLLGKEIPHFCFPAGKKNNALVQIAKKYFQTLRTADTAAVVDDAIIIKPTFHFYNRGKKSLLFNGFKHGSPVFNYTLQNILNPDYWELMKCLIGDLAKSSNHYKIMVWGHSWEIEEFGIWDKLEDLFSFINTNYQKNVFEYSDFVKIKVS